MKFELINDLVVVDIEGKKYLVDTGSAISFSLRNDLNLRLGGRDYLLRENHLVNAFKKTLSRVLPNVQIDGIIGTDIIVKTNLSINFLQGEIYFDLVDFPYDIDQYVLPLTYKFYHFFVKFPCDYGDINVIVDSGSTVWYIKSKYLNLNNPLGELMDYSPEIGEIHDYYYDFYDGVHQNPISVGKLPSDYELCTDGIMPLYSFAFPGYCQFNFKTGEFKVTRRFL